MSSRGFRRGTFCELLSGLIVIMTIGVVLLLEISL